VEISKNEPESSAVAPRRPIQFGLGNLLQLITVAALWCGVFVVRDNYPLAVGLATLTTIATWVVVGRWAVNLSPRACRHVLAATTATMAAAGIVLSELRTPVVWPVQMPIAVMLTRLLVFLMAVRDLASPGLRPTAFVAIECVLVLSITYGVCWPLFAVWDQLSSRSNRRLLAILYSIVLAVMCMPVALYVLVGVDEWMRYGLFHAFALELWVLELLHVVMLLVAVIAIGSLAWHALRGTAAPPNWLKLLTWGCIGLYGVMLFVALLCESIPYEAR
jgi:hypothetical protein